MEKGLQRVKVSAATVDGARMAVDIEAIAAFSEGDPHVGHNRPTFSPAWRHARDYVISQESSLWRESFSASRKC